MTFDPSRDFTIFDGAETVVYQPACGAAIQVAGVLREQQTTAAAAFGSGLGLEPTDLPFDFPAPNMSGVAPAPGDSFTDSGGVGWTVISIALDSLTRQYRIIGRQRRQ